MGALLKGGAETPLRIMVSRGLLIIGANNRDFTVWHESGDRAPWPFYQDSGQVLEGIS